MKLNKKQKKILQLAREELEGDWEKFICCAINYISENYPHLERYNANNIIDRIDQLIGTNSSLEVWLRKNHLDFYNTHQMHNSSNMKQYRLAWIDKILKDGEL